MCRCRSERLCRVSLQVDKKLVKQRDENYGVFAEQQRESRQGYITPPDSVAEGADSWTSGRAPQLPAGGNGRQAAAIVMTTIVEICDTFKWSEQKRGKSPRPWLKSCCNGARREGRA